VKERFWLDQSFDLRLYICKRLSELEEDIEEARADGQYYKREVPTPVQLLAAELKCSQLDILKMFDTVPHAGTYNMQQDLNVRLSRIEDALLSIRDTNKPR
jgi:hypothetical protein